MASKDAVDWNCGEFTEVLTLLNKLLENGLAEQTDAVPEALSCSRVQRAVEAQRQHLEALLIPAKHQPRTAVEDGTAVGSEASPSDAAAGEVAGAAPGDAAAGEVSAAALGSAPDDAQVAARRLQALPEAVGSVLDVLVKLWQAHEQRCKQPVSGPNGVVEELSRRLQESECQLTVAQEEQAEAVERENNREMRLCRMMAQEAREAAELRQALRRSEQSAGPPGQLVAVEEKNKAVAQLERCQQELAKAQRRNNELLKDLKMLCTPTYNAPVNEVEVTPPIPESEKQAEDAGWNPMKGIKDTFGENVAATLGGMWKIAEANPLALRNQGAYGSLARNGKVSAPADGGKDQASSSPTMAGTPRTPGTASRGGNTPRHGAMTPRSLNGTAATTPRGMPSSMRELAQILAPQKIVQVDQSTPEARINQLQKVVRELTADLRERDARIKKLVAELRRLHESSNGVMNLEVLGDDDGFAMQDTAPMSARGVRGESGSIAGLRGETGKIAELRAESGSNAGPAPTNGATNRPKIQRLNLPVRDSEDTSVPQSSQAA